MSGECICFGLFSQLNIIGNAGRRLTSGLATEMSVSDVLYRRKFCWFFAAGAEKGASREVILGFKGSGNLLRHKLGVAVIWKFLLSPLSEAVWLACR